MKIHEYQRHSWIFGADDEARTRYLHLGKVALYQMSYIRICRLIITKQIINVNRNLLTKIINEYIIILISTGVIAMKKAIALLCVFSLIFAVCACGKPGGDSDTTGNAEAETDLPATQVNSGNNNTVSENTNDTDNTGNTLSTENNNGNTTAQTTAAEKAEENNNSETPSTTKGGSSKSNNKKPDTQKSNGNTPSPQKNEVSTTADNSCKHGKTVIKNQKTQNCTESGYTGDVYCSDCGKLLEKGDVIEPDGHLSVEVYNIIPATKNAPGYTGDKRCRICGAELEKGEVIPKLAADPEPVSHNNAELEYELLNLLNAERAKEGYAPLSFNENAYRCAKLRTAEIMVKFSHERPIGGYFNTILENDGVSYSTAGENIQRGTSDNTVQQMADAFMNSEAHRANIMNNKYTSAAICVEYAGGAYFVTQIFIG